MTAEHAMALAEELHRWQTDFDGSPHFDHVRRVALMVPPDCRRVAWLHDVVEDTPATLSVLSALPHDELAAVDLLTRRDGESYADFIARIATARGEAGRVARRVKEADLVDNLSRCLRSTDARSASLANRYRESLPIVQAAVMTDRTGT